MMGRPQTALCQNGHDMAVTRRRYPSGDAYCYECKKARTYQFRRDNPELAKQYTKTSRRRRSYGLEPEQYAALLEDQHGTCAVCREQPTGRGLHVDHDHETGEIRGLLCHNCNTALGLFKDNMLILTAAMAYLSVARKGKKK